jgi:hypothetical protein
MGARLQTLHGDGREKKLPTAQGKSWHETMTNAELLFLRSEFMRILSSGKFGGCIDNYRAARIWKSSQVRRYLKDRDHGCCGSYDTVVEKWNWTKLRYDKYLLGFNYGH